MAKFGMQDAYAIVDPRMSPNNKVGIGILSPEANIEEAAGMVNNNGDWGYVLILIKRNERDIERWQKVFNQLRDRRLIPIVRLATDVDSGGNWTKPSDDDAVLWADFLSQLYWPTKNKYVQVYNEVNRATEWGGSVDPAGYARELSKTISALKAEDDDFFVLNAPLDLALATSSNSLDAGEFFQQMESSSGGIFTKLDGWASHSYPNPAFSASPLKSGRTGIDGYKWEISQIGAGNLPVFITETGWDRSTLSEEEVAENYKVGFEKVWNDKNVVAVTPFVFDYPDGLFHNFSFLRDTRVLGQRYYPQYEALKNLEKDQGAPVREELAVINRIYLPRFLISKVENEGQVIVKNTGNYVWKSENMLIDSSVEGVDITDVEWPKDTLFPGEETVVKFKFRVEEIGTLELNPQIKNGGNLVSVFPWQIVSETLGQRALRIARQILG